MRIWIGLIVMLLVCLAAVAAPPEVRVTRVPEGGIQPLACVGADGAVHLVYFKGEAKGGDLFHVRRERGAAEFGAPVRINNDAGDVVAAGTIRGAQIALGKDNRVHVVWNGSGRQKDGKIDHERSGVMYTRLGAAGAFEPARNLMTHTALLDGGCTIAADATGRVTVAWHAVEAGAKSPSEADRRVYVATSEDEGKTFGAEVSVTPEPGVCACCGMAALADGGCVSILFRGAAGGSERGMVLLRGGCAGKPAEYVRKPLQEWRVQACPMSSASIAAQPSSFGAVDPRLAWETEGQVWFATVSSADGTLTRAVAPPGGDQKNRKHPRVAVDAGGRVLMVWTEGTGWNRGGALAWQQFDAKGVPVEGARGTAPGIAVWSFGAAVALPGGGFEIIY